MAGPMKLVVLGTGGTSLDILDIVHAINQAEGRVRYECVALLDDNRALAGSIIHGVPVRGPLASAPEYRDCAFVNGIGSPSNFWRKDAILAATRLDVDRFVSLVHPSCAVSRHAVIGAGTVVFPHVTIGTNVRIGTHVMLLPSTVVSHDAVIGDYTCVAGGVCLSGSVRVGRLCYLGTASSVIGGAAIGDGALVGMGSVVLRTVAPNTVVIGNPARALRPVLGAERAAAARA